MIGMETAKIVVRSMQGQNKAELQEVGNGKEVFFFNNDFYYN